MSKLNLTVEPGKNDFRYTRVLDAPRELVYRAYTDPDLLRQWLGPRRLTMTLCNMDVRPGGSWRFVHADNEGHEYGFHGVFHDVKPNERLVRTFEWEGMPGHVSLETAEFEEQGDKTLIKGQSVFQSVEDRDGMVSSGMEAGWEQLDEALEQFKKRELAGR